MDRFHWKPLLLACLIVSIGQLSLGLIFPSLPWIAQDLGISADQAQYLVSGYLLGFGGSQLIYGPLSDVIGRRPVLLSGLLIAMVGLLISVFQAESFTWLLAGRCIQGLGAGSVSVLARATIRDSYLSHHLVKAMSWVAIVAAFTPIIAPVLGGLINHYAGWLAVFVLLLGYVAVIWLLMAMTFKETLAKPAQSRSVGQLVMSYGTLLRERHFLIFAGIGWLNFALVVLAISLLPFIMQVQIGMSSDEYALWAMVPAVGFLTGGLLCQRLSPKFGAHRMLLIAPVMQLTAGLILICSPLVPAWVITGHFFLAMTNGLAFPCAQSLLLVPYRERSGTVSALSGACQMMLASLASNLLLKAGIQQPAQLGGVILIAALAGALLVALGTRSSSGRRAVASLSEVR